MHRVYRKLMSPVVVMVMVFGFAFTTMSQPAYSVEAPAVSLKNWKVSSEQEKLSFLIGFMTMVDIERAWQGTPPLDVSQSTTCLWLKGLTGVSLAQMIKSVDDYIETHPNALDQSVLEVIGRLYVSPKLTAAEKQAAQARYNAIKDTL